MEQIGITAVFIVGGVRLYCEGLRVLLAAERSLGILGAGLPDEASLISIGQLRPRVVLIDSSVARGASFVRRARDAAPGCAVVALGITNDEAEVLGCAEAGVSGYVAATASASELADSVRTVVAGSFPCPASTASVLMRRLGEPADRSAQLTRRENDILGLIDRGCSNKEIAVELDIEVATVKNHVHNILGKLGVSRRGVAAAKRRSGLA